MKELFDWSCCCMITDWIFADNTKRQATLKGAVGWLYGLNE